MVQDRVPAEDDIAKEAAAQMARRRHDPAHAEQRSQLLGMAG
jgi:hypothetical protein